VESRSAKFLRKSWCDLAGDEVGYGKPPKKNRFSKGQSGNPKGRPKGSKSPATIFEQAAQERVSVTIGGETRKMSKLEAIAIQMANKAAAGDPKAVHTFLYWLNKTSEDASTIDPVAGRPEENDVKMMATILKRFRPTNDYPSVSETAQPPRELA
jgi:Family of unknown function (DUF5681)